MTEKFKYIFSLKLAGYLMMNGCRILRINHNLNIQDKDVYVFEYTEDLRKIMSEYSNKNSKEKYKDGNNNKRSSN